ncbi:MAG TPA: polysaccharide biosynthesis/export family protein [Pedobacter sp.]|nr:polysaccharide biosynthesis/export family protein [Pedobacter sp.]
MKNIHLLLVCVLCSTLLCVSCGSYKNVPYFQKLAFNAENPEPIDNFSPITIQSSDILSVSVSSLNPLAFNDSTGRVSGYLVNEKGEIRVPVMGPVKVTGLTVSQAEAKIQKGLTPFLKNPDVVIRIKNFKISVLGDVAKPNVYPVLGEKISVTEALSMAGDLNITAKRKNILLVREVDGKRAYVPLDITSPDFFRSPYYYMKNNDILYVEPDKTKYATVDGSYRTYGLVLSGLSIVAIILTSLIR